MDLLPTRRRFGDLESLRNEMDQLWDRFFTEPFFPQFFLATKMPMADIVEDNDKIVIKADLPGLEKKDINVTLNEDVLTIKGERSTEKEEKGKNYYRQERHFGKFQRSFKLPAEVKNDKVDAVFSNGVLQVTLKKTEAQKKKAIEIKVK